VRVYLPGGADWVWVTLDRRPYVRLWAVELAESANPVWGWDLARCESAFVVSCDDHDTDRPREVRDAHDAVAAALQEATRGFRFEVRYDRTDPEGGPRVIPPADGSG
jgi:hypothetical protein